jgi:hypothetical protein
MQAQTTYRATTYRNDDALIAIDDRYHREISATQAATVVLGLRVGRAAARTLDLQKETTDQLLRFA